MKKIALVTGATGFVGSHLTRRLLKENFTIHILTRLQSDFWRIRDILPQLHNHQGDLTDFKSLKTVVQKIKPNYIFHTAAAGIHGGKSLSDKEMMEINSIGFINLIEALNSLDYEAFINTGSSAEYGKKEAPMKESDLCEPVNAYAISKLAATLYANAIAKAQSKPIITLRLFSPYGPYDDSTRLVVYTINRALGGSELELGNQASVRDFIYIEDAVDAYFRCLGRAREYAGEVFNIGSGKETSTKVMVESIRKLSGAQIAAKWGKETPRSWESAHWQADISKAKKLLGWQPKHDLNSGLIKTIAWFKKNQQFYK